MTTMNHSLRQLTHALRHNETGATLVEFSLTCIILLTMILVVAEFCIAMYTYHFVSYSAQQAARYAIVRGARWTQSCASTNNYDCQASATDIQNYVQGLAPPGVNPASLTVTTSWPGKSLKGATAKCVHKNSDGCTIEITVSYPFGMHLPLLPSMTTQFTAHSEMVIQQ